jgi:hypothetical protein
VKIYLVIGAILAVSTLQADIVISPGNMGTWAFDTTDNNGTSCSLGGNSGNNCDGSAVAQMVNGPDTPPLGVGSAELMTSPNSGGDGAAVISDSELDGKLISTLTALSYSAYDSVNNGQQFPYLAIAITWNGGASMDTLFFEPPYQTAATGSPTCAGGQATVMKEWQTWNALAGCWWDNNSIATGGTGVMSLSAILTAEGASNATIVPLSALGLNNTEGGLDLQVGYGTNTDNYTGYVDNVTIGINGANTTYDFEPNGAVPEPSSILLLITFCTGIAVVTRLKLFRANRHLALPQSAPATATDR